MLVRCLTLSAPALLASVANAELIYGVTLEQTLVTYESSAPGTLISGVAISGLQANEVIRGIDIRPATRELYALGSFNRLYKINAATGVATQVGGVFSTALNGSQFGFDFNPTVDRIRVTSDADQNLRLNPITGAVAAVDGNLAYNAGDSGFGMNPNIVASAYTNNFAGATSTTLYNVDSLRDALVIQNPPNAGGLVTVGFLGTDVTDMAGFDISGSTGIAYMTIRDANLARSTFWKVDLTTGAAMMIGEVGGGAIITAMTVVPTPGTLGLMGLGGTAALRRRRR
jgi:hypothetical protein